MKINSGSLCNGHTYWYGRNSFLLHSLDGIVLIDTSKIRRIDGENERYYEIEYEGEIYKFISVTTVLGKMLSKPALVPWAFNYGVRETHALILEGLKKFREQDRLDEFILSLEVNDWTNVKDSLSQYGRTASSGSKQSQERGTYIHKCLEEIIAGKSADKDKFDPEMLLYVEQIERFCDEYEPEWIESESIVVSMTGEYAGTLDAVCKINNHPPRKRHPSLVGKKVIADLKTGKDGRVYPESHYPQLCAYGHARREMGFDHDNEIIIAVGPESYSVGVNYYPHSVFHKLYEAWKGIEEGNSLNPNGRKKK